MIIWYSNDDLVLKDPIACQVERLLFVLVPVLASRVLAEVYV